MTQFFVGNFEFEHQLACREPRPIPRTAIEMASVWLAIAQPDDVFWMPVPPEPSFVREMADQGFAKVRCVSRDQELAEFLKESTLFCCPWGWSPQMVAWAEQRNLAFDSPNIEAVRLVNSRRFSFALELELGIWLNRAAEIASIEELPTALRHFGEEDHWVLKCEFGMSARERLLGRGRELFDNQLGWVRKRLLPGQVLILEPWVRSLGEAGLQFEVPKPGEGTPRFLGVTPMVTDASGVYRGSRFDEDVPSSLDWSEAVTVGQTVAERAQDLGYFGPLGIDAMWYLDGEGTARLRPLQDLNARWTMGRLSLGFRSRLEPGESGIWLHFRCPAKTAQAAREWWDRLRSSLPQNVRFLRTSPVTIGGQVTQHATAVLMSDDFEALQSASGRLLSAR